jgi:predicted DNA binding CopG/RHH family protein
MTKQTRISVYLDPQLIKAIKVFAAQNGLTLSSVAEKAFEKLLHESEK